MAEPTPRDRVSDWQLTEELLSREPTRWGSLSWTSARTLIDGVNQVLNFGSDQLVKQLRNRWVTGDPPLISQPGVQTFMIIGDTGEQDASQYVVSPALSDAVRAHEPGFVMIMSDVIYPAGHVDDYVDGVYRPYRGESPHFRVDAPLLAIPGNHDWYDGLAGFMYHFCDRPHLPLADYTPPRLTPKSLLARPFRILWRRPTEPTARTRHHHDHPIAPGQALTGEITQPGPYYAIDTAQVRIVAIDTGIDGNLDTEQGAWLKRVSAGDRPKVLVTGKPLLVNGTLHPCWIGPPVRGRPRESVWKLINDPRHHYVATIGGDVHNFQHYDGPLHHIVCGSGGAFMHATHSYAMADRDSRIRNSPTHPFHSMPVSAFPDPFESFSYFARLLVPGVKRMFRNVILFLFGVLIATLAALGGAWAGFGSLGARTAGWAALASIGTVVVVRTLSRDIPRTSRLAHGLVATAAFLTGALSASLAYQLDPDRYLVYLTAWSALTIAHCLFSAAIRRSGWWCPADEHAENLRWPAFVLGLLGLCVVTAALLLAAGPAVNGLLALGGAAVVGAVGLIGAFCRRRRFTRPGIVVPESEKPKFGRANRRWYQWSGIVVPLVQSIVFVIGLYQLADRVNRPWIFTGGAASVALLVGLIVVALLAVTVLTEIVAGLGAIGPQSYAESWGRTAAVTHHLMTPLILIGLVTWIALADTPITRTSSGLAFVTVPIVGYLLFVAWLRQRRPKGYLYAVLIILVGAGTALVLAYRADVWLVRTGLGTGIVMIALGTSVLIGHLFFLGAQFLLGPTGSREVSFSTAEIAEIFRARRERPPRVPAVPEQVMRWARLAAPGLGEAGGILQRGVSEIYSSDVPPFYKGFLRLDTTPNTLTITLHQVFGRTPSTPVPVAVIDLTRRPEPAVPTMS